MTGTAVSAYNSCVHRPSQDFVCGGALSLRQKSDDLFLVNTLSYTVIYVIYCHQLRFYLLCGGARWTSPKSAPFPLIPTKMPRKIFFVALGGAPAPHELPGYAYSTV